MSDTPLKAEEIQCRADNLRICVFCATIYLSVLMIGNGCARNIVRATKLPAEYAAPHVENAQTIDLAKLSAPTAGNELIDRGDVIEVTLASHYSSLKDRGPTTSPVRVGSDGYATIPLIGRLPLAGLNLNSAEQAVSIAAEQRGIFRAPLVTVTMLKQRMNKVMVLGAVVKPGIYELPRGSSALLNALTVAGGLSEEAGIEVEVRRPGVVPGSGQLVQNGVDSGNVQAQYVDGQPSGSVSAVATRINLVQAAKEGQGGHYLNDGDVVMVYKRDPHPIHVIGLVRDPGEFELPVNREMRVLDALAKAKGVSSQVADRVHVIRQVPNKTEPIVIQVSLREAKTTGKGNLRLASGDIISVEQTWATGMYDTVNNFVRFGISGSVPLF